MQVQHEPPSARARRPPDGSGLRRGRVMVLWREFSESPTPVILYRLILSLALPVVIAGLVWRVIRGRERPTDLAERLGGGAVGSPGALWLHAASNGELASARGLIAALLARAPGLRILVTTNTTTARTLARSWDDPRITARLAPLDARWALARFFAQARPAALIVVENELWPNRLSMAAARGIPVFAVGARISARSAQRWARIGLGARMMATLSGLSAQDAGSEAAFQAMGLAPDRLWSRANLKTEAGAGAVTERLDWPRAETVLAASTHEGEEALVLAAFAAARALRPGLRLILAPRHPRRAPEVAAAIRAAGLDFAQRSQGGAPDKPVYLADTMGEMGNWYAAAGICFIGGTFAPRGGHTPFEPAAEGCALLHGLDIANHAEAFAALDAAGGALTVTPETLGATLAGLDAAGQARMAQAAQAALGALGGAGAAAQLAEKILEKLDLPRELS